MMRILILVLMVAYSDQQYPGLINQFARIFQQNFPDVDEFHLRKEYDFIVVGAGSAGSVVASRLSENWKWNVLLLEAGEDETFLTDIPVLASLHASTPHSWGYRSEKLKTGCLGFVDRRCVLPRGKVMGGTSTINFLIYTRGHKKDFDEWAELGNYGWSYKDVLPYFIKSENCTSCSNIEEEYHGKEGPLHIENTHYRSEIMEEFLDSAEALGYENNDPNGSKLLGFSEVQATMTRGRRCSTSKAYLKPYLDRPNLHVSLKTRATKVRIDPTTKVAYGVEFLKNRKRYFIKAKKEVILSAGSFNSPQLLMLSGVGPKDLLLKHKIPVIEDLKVGFNLQDHVALSNMVFLVNDSVTVSQRYLQSPIQALNYIFRGSGPYTIPGGAEALAFVKTKYSENKTDDYPDIELVLGAGGIHDDRFGVMRALLGIPTSTYNRMYEPVSNRYGFSIVPVLMRPKSRGRLIIKDANPLHWPLIYTNYFEDPQDVKVMTEGIRAAIDVSKRIDKYNAQVNSIPHPSCQHLPFGEDDYWECFIRNMASTLGHQVGTCKMGPKTDPDAVVDPELRVKGVKRLRVVDGSILPNIVAGHTNAVIVMIGEKASDMIIKDWLDEYY